MWVNAYYECIVPRHMVIQDMPHAILCYFNARRQELGMGVVCLYYFETIVS